MIKDTNRDCPVSGLPDQKAGIEVCLEDDRWPQALKHPERLAIQAIELTIRYFEETNTDPKRFSRAERREAKSIDNDQPHYRPDERYCHPIFEQRLSRQGRPNQRLVISYTYVFTKPEF